MGSRNPLRTPFLEERNTHDHQRWSLACSNDARRRVLVESKKLWRIAGPAMFTRIAMYGMTVITLAFVGHLGELELAAMSIAITVVLGFNYGFLLGMGSALETLCGQAFGGQQYHMMGVYLQRSCIVVFAVAVLLLPTYIFATPILNLVGQSHDIAKLSGAVSIWLIPIHFAFGFTFTFQRFLQSQLKNMITAWIAAVAFVIQIVLSWLFIFRFDMGLIGAAMALNLSGWVLPIAQLIYIVCGGCPQTWTGLSIHAFDDLWPYAKLSVASGVMICLEYWYYRVLVLLTGYLRDPVVAVDSLSICLNVSSWEQMIPFGFFAGTSVRVANELGTGNGRAAKFAVIVSATTSTAIGVVFTLLIIAFRQDIALAFTSSAIIRDAVCKLAILLAFAVLLNSVQPVLSGYSDSYWAGDLNDRRSVTGYAFNIRSGVISWSNKKQGSVPLSSVDVKYQDVCATTSEEICLRRILHDAGEEQKEATVIKCGNQSSIKMENNLVFHKNTKNVDTQFHFVREKVQSKEIFIEHCNTCENVVDIFTKPLGKTKFELFREMLGV